MSSGAEWVVAYPTVRPMTPDDHFDVIDPAQDCLLPEARLIVARGWRESIDWAWCEAEMAESITDRAERALWEDDA